MNKNLIFSDNCCTFASDNESLKQAGGPASGVLRRAKRPEVERFDTQITAERGIENGLLFVTPIFLNHSDCLYTKKDCFFFQNYEIIPIQRPVKEKKNACCAGDC